MYVQCVNVLISYHFKNKYMRSILLVSCLFLSMQCAAQFHYSGYRDFIENSVRNPDLGKDSSLKDDYIVRSEIVNPYTPLKDIFYGRPFDRSTDNVYFSINSNYYQMFLPELHMLLTVSSTQPDRSVGEHLVWMISEIRKWKKAQ